MGSPGVIDADVAVIGAGPVGLTLAARLAQHGVRTVIVDAAPGLLGEGSRAICMQRETLEIWARAGIGEQVAARGVQWRLGRTYFRSRELFSVELPGAVEDHFPPFVNISQSEVEELLLGRARELGVEPRWRCRLTGLDQGPESVSLTLATPDGEESLTARYAVGADGGHSAVRELLAIGFSGRTFDDRFLICDVRARLPFPSERRFFFDPPWNPGRQVLIHPQPDDVWRIDWQIPRETDIDAEESNGGLERRIRAIVGPETEYELVWRSVYRFHQRLADRFRSGRGFLVGDAAHLYAPFGARGLNSGVADAENLAWKLALVLRGDAPAALLDTFERERRAAAAENLAVTEATMRYLVPRGPWQRLWRAVTLRGSSWSPGLRRRVNSGSLAAPFAYTASPITFGDPSPPGSPREGSVAPDVVLESGERLRSRFGRGFIVLLADASAELAARATGRSSPLPVEVVTDPSLTPTYAATGPRAWIVRPDGHLAGSLALAGPADVDRLPSLLAASVLR